MAKHAATSRSTRSVKIVVTGPFGAGKTSLISTISEIDVLSTEKAVSQEGDGTKKSTTVAMDFGRLTVDDDLALYLFGTPGQKRFDFMWDILAEGMLGFIVMIDPNSEESLQEAVGILRYFREAASVPFVVAVNKIDGDSDAAVAKVRKRLDLDDTALRVVACNALERESVKTVLLELLYAVLHEIDQREPAAV